MILRNPTNFFANLKIKTVVISFETVIITHDRNYECLQKYLQSDLS
jgi:hypothetical protein